MDISCPIAKKPPDGGMKRVGCLAAYGGITGPEGRIGCCWKEAEGSLLETGTGRASRVAASVSRLTCLTSFGLSQANASANGYARRSQ